MSTLLKRHHWGNVTSRLYVHLFANLKEWSHYPGPHQADHPRNHSNLHVSWQLPWVINLQPEEKLRRKWRLRLQKLGQSCPRSRKGERLRCDASFFVPRALASCKQESATTFWLFMHPWPTWVHLFPVLQYSLFSPYEGLGQLACQAIRNQREDLRSSDEDLPKHCSD